MCNLYNITTSQEAIRQWTRALRDILGNLEPSIDIYPNQPGPVVRNAADGQRELANLLWGMPTPLERVKGKADYGTTNIRNPQYGHWQQYLGVENRCVVPVTSFAEPSPTPGDKDRDRHSAQCLVRPRRGPAAVLLRRPVDALARRAQGQGRTAATSSSTAS